MKNNKRKKMAVGLLIGYLIFATIMVITVVFLSITMFDTILNSFGY